MDAYYILHSDPFRTAKALKKKELSNYIYIFFNKKWYEFEAVNIKKAPPDATGSAPLFLKY